MNQPKEEKKLLPPYIAFKSFMNFIDRLKVGIPARIDRSLMGSYSGGIQAQLFSALKYLKLISEHGTPTEKLTKLVMAEGADKQKALKDIIMTSYLFLFGDGIDLKRVTAHQLEELFDKEGPTAGTNRKCLAFFMRAAKEAGIELSPHIGKIRGITSRNYLPRIKKDRESKLNDGLSHEDLLLENNLQNIPWQKLLLSKFPSFDPSWPDEVKAKWFDGFKDLMSQFKEISEK